MLALVPQMSTPKRKLAILIYLVGGLQYYSLGAIRSNLNDCRIASFGCFLNLYFSAHRVADELQDLLAL